MAGVRAFGVLSGFLARRYALMSGSISYFEAQLQEKEARGVINTRLAVSLADN